jgi:hypothetical protein
MRDLGDFQTPPALVEQILRVLGPVGRRWPRVLEPTCGRGNFLAGLLGQDPPPREIRAFELQASHADQAKTVAGRRPLVRTEITVANIFDVDLRTGLNWAETGPLLVLGNPPWVTNAELGGLGSTNLPAKKNWRKLRGIDAMTGRSNFDLAECVWIKTLTELAGECPTVAMLCKTSVARNIIEFLHEQSLPVVEASVYGVDAAKWFDAAVDACFLVVELGAAPATGSVKFYPSLNASEPHSVLTMGRAFRVADPALYAACCEIDGACTLAWRQGIKHDAARIMELESVPGGGMQNRLGQTVDVEQEFLYPLLKASDLFHQVEPRPRRFVIVTQRTLSEDTEKLRHEAPKLWKYLRSHVKIFQNRKSAVFAGRPRFALFGVGEYSFARFKVAVAGFYKEARFRALKPICGRPVLVDDTCYCVACEGPKHAALVAALLNDPLCSNLMSSLVFRDAKRPVTKAILQRVDLKAILSVAHVAALRSRYIDELRRLKGNAPSSSAGERLALPSTDDEFLDHVMRLI